MQLAWRHYRAGTREDARLISIRVLQVEPSNSDALHLLGVLAYEANNQTMAIDLITEAIRGNRRFAPMHGNLALAKLANGDLNGAAMSARKAFSLNPSFADAHRVLGLVFRAKGQHQEAIRAFERAKALGIETEELHRNLSEAREEYRSLKKSGPPSG
jgi:Tfp pilus assembly protein PilF